ncbi:MAG: T9SS type A sorting domain-containing protein [Bacteroidetes bacterium]|nr:T9SS type A sorting domain-containing protein [Bacteroidota bacterium]
MQTAPWYLRMMDMKRYALLASLILFSLAGSAQTNFRSNGTGGGLWSATTTWQVETPNGSGTWVAASSTPTSASNTIEIRANDVVTVSANVTIDQTTVDVGGTLVVSDAITLTLRGVINALVVNGTLNMLAESILRGGGGTLAPSGSFVVNGTLQNGSLNTTGALVANTSRGNIRTTVANRIYNSGATIVYAGAGAQFIGNGQPTISGVITEINNNSGVSSSGTVTIPGDLILTNGDLNIVGTSSLTLNGNITSNLNHINFSGTSNSLTVNGTGALGTFPFPSGSQTMRNLTFNRTSGSITFNNDLSITGTATVNSGTVTFGGTTSITGAVSINAGTVIVGAATSITGAVSMASGTVLAFDGQSLSMANNFTSSGLLSASGASSLTLTGSTPLTSPINFVGSNNTLQSLTINKTNTGTSVQVGASGLNVTNTLTLTDGLFDISSGLNLSSGSVFNFNSTAAASPTTISQSPTGGPWTLNYSGTTSKTTGPEIPASGILNGLTTSNTGTITLNQALTIGSGGLTETAGRFTCGANAVSTSSLSISSGIFTAPSSTLTLTGDISVSGTYTHNSGQLIFAGSTAQSILGTNASTTNFNTIIINSGATLVSPATLNVYGDFTNNGTFTAGTNTVSFENSANQTVSGSSNTQFYDLTVAKTAAANTVTISSAQTITNNFTLTQGTCNVNAAVSMTNPSGVALLTAGTLAITSNLLSLTSGVTVNVVRGLVTTSSPTGAWNLTYTGTTAAYTTGLEIPTSGGGSLLGVTVVTNTRTVTLSSAMTVGTAGFTLTSGNFSCGANAVSTPTVTITSGTFTAPNTTLTLTGDISINGIYTHNSGQLIFAGSSPQNILGSNASTTTFRTVVINSGATLVSPSTLNLTGDFTNNGSFTAGSNTVSFGSNTTETVSGTSNTQFYNLTLNKSVNGNTVTISSAQTVTNNITLTRGTLSITGNLLNMNSGASIDVVAGRITTSSPSGSWDLTYSNTANYNTGFEVPTSGGVLLNVTVAATSGATVTLTDPMNVTGTSGFTQTSGNFSSGANAISALQMNLNGGVFTEPSSTLTLTSGNLTVTGGTFTANNGEIIFAGTSAQTITGAGATNFSSITVNSGATFSAPSSLNLIGTLQNDGTFTHNSGIVTFAPNNATAQIAGSSKFTFYNISVTDGVPATDLRLENSSGADLINILDVGAATFDADGSAGNRVFRLISSAEKPVTDASIAPIQTGGAVTGNVTVQRYMARIGDPAYNYQVWRDISAPVTSDVADLQSSLPVTGPFTGASSVSGASNTSSSMQQYTETTTTDTNGDSQVTLDDGWADFPVSTNTESFTTGQGYSIFIFGADSETNGADLWSLRGPIHSGNISLPVTYTDKGSGVANNGWNLVGNPYPSTIDWTTATLTNVDDAIYFDDYSTATPVFVSYVAGVSTNNFNSIPANYIAAGQGFWVKANAASPSIQLTESSKVNTVLVPGLQSAFYRQAAPTNLIRVTLNSDNQKDETVIYFSDSTTADFDKKYDALKRRNQYWYLNLSSVSAKNENYAINGLPFHDCAMNMALDVSDVATGTYSLSFSDYAGLPSSMTIQLKDNYTNSTTDIRTNQTYSFSVDQNTAATFGASRFSLMFSYQGGVVPITTQNSSVCDSTQAKITIQNSSTDFSYSLASASDQSVIIPSVAGTGGDLSFAIPSNKIVAGSNKFIILEKGRYCYSLTAADSVSVSYVAAPGTPATVSSSLSCGSGPVTLTASGAPNGGHYNWYDSLNATSSYATQTAEFTTNTLSKSKDFYVSISNSLGCEGNRIPVMANVVSLTPVSISVVDLQTLQSSYNKGNQWYLNDQPIPGATDQVLKVEESGIYKVEVTSQGCSVSTEKEMVITSIAGSENGINVYPNPVREMMKVEVSGASETKGDVYNSVGQHISPINFSFNGQNNSANYFFGNQSSGIYYARINQGGRVWVVRIVKE